MTRMRPVRLLVTSALFVGGYTAWGQVRLSVSDAEVLLGHLPAVIRSNSGRGCPALELESLSDSHVTLVARAICSPEPSGLIGRYTVDRFTGEVRNEPDTGAEEELDSEGASVLRRLRDGRLAQMLTPGDALCLAKGTAVMRKLREEGACPAFGTVRLEDRAAAVLSITSTCRASSSLAVIGRLEVDRDSGLVRDGFNGEILDLTNPGLRSDLLLARALPAITPAEAEQLVEAGALVSGSLGGPPAFAVDPVISGGDEMWFASSLRYPEKGGGLFRVNRHDGAVWNASTGEALQSPRLGQLRAKFLKEAEARKRAASERSRATCGE